MRVALFIFIFLSSCFKLSAQSLYDLQRKLSENKLSVLNQFIIESDTNHLDVARWHVLREIAPGYSEGIAFFNFYVPPHMRDSFENNYNQYRLNVLSQHDSIIYYQVEEKNVGKVSSAAYRSYLPVTIFENESAFFDFNLSFYKRYQVYVDKSQLFIDTLIYGNYCGIAATPPPQRNAVNYFVENNNAKALLDWLTSPNSEKQVYAIDGLLQLKKKGYKLDKRTLKIIKYILGKSGTIRTCEGCIESSQEINELIKM